MKLTYNFVRIKGELYSCNAKIKFKGDSIIYINNERLEIVKGGPDSMLVALPLSLTRGEVNDKMLRARFSSEKDTFVVGTTVFFRQIKKLDE